MKNTIQFSNGAIISIPKMLFAMAFVISVLAIVFSAVVSITYDIQFFSQRTIYLAGILVVSLFYLLYKKPA